MRQEKKWPKFIELQYYDESSGGIKGFSGFMNNSEMMLEVLYRYRITEPNLLRWVVQDIKDPSKEVKVLNSEAISKMFVLYDLHRKEIEEKNEKRETSNKKTKGTDPGGKVKS
ncbi:hypothetical protein [Peribacillus aracenensis]|uniref:hypothetical protein n=1 Tax=Peribacillus aracenensis TaxID=2976708 RepID=UPI0021A4F2ED|nr:hypothetical protein [Peribacillus sp. BBB004]